MVVAASDFYFGTGEVDLGGDDVEVFNGGGLNDVGDIGCGRKDGVEAYAGDGCEAEA